MDAPKLGKLIGGDEGRDAIHIAIAPAIAAKKLKPGQHVGLVDGGFASCKDPIGIVDPFLTGDVLPGQKFFVCLYPGTITSLRHEWTHPGFAMEGQVTERELSKQWIDKFADDIGLSPSVVMEAGDAWVDEGRYTTVGENEAYKDVGRKQITIVDLMKRNLTDKPTPPEQDDWSVWRLFWHHYAILSGKNVPETEKERCPFSCSC